MESEEEPIAVNGVRFYLSPGKLLSREGPVLSGDALRSAISPKLVVTARSRQDTCVTREKLVDATAEIYRELLGEIGSTEEARALRAQCHDLAAIVPDFFVTLGLTQYWGLLAPMPGMKTDLDRIQRGADPRTAPEEHFERIELIVSFTYSLVACVPQG